MLRERVQKGSESGSIVNCQESWSSPKECQLQREITIRLVGDLKENIADIVSRLRCSSSCRESVQYILTQYACKIQKLRQERDLYRQMIVMKAESHQKSIEALKNEIYQLKEALKQQNKRNAPQVKCTCQHLVGPFGFKQNMGHDSIAVGSSTNRFREQYLPSPENLYLPSTENQQSEVNQMQANLQEQISDISREGPEDEPQMEKQSSKEEELLIEHQTQNGQVLKDKTMNRPAETSPVREKTIGEEELVKLMLRYNFSMDQLQNILYEYQNEHRLAEEMFDSEDQRNLYRLGQKMQKDLWNKKVLNDVKRLSRIKRQVVDSSQ